MMHSAIATRMSPAWPRIQPPVRGLRGPLPVMFIITSMPVGGAEVLLRNLIERFDPERVRPEVVCLKQRGPLGEAIAQRWPVHCHLLKSKFDLLVVPRLVRLMRARGAAAVVTVGAGDKMFWGRIAAWTAGVPVILSALHSTGWPDGVDSLNRLLTPITDGFIAVADQHADHLRNVERFPAARVHAIRNGIDTSRFVPDSRARAAIRDEMGVNAQAPVFGIIAALRPEKNHAMFLRVAARVRRACPGAHFIIVGDGPERALIERKIAEGDLDGAVHMLGTRHDTPEILAALDAFLLCSHNEASPVSILEALSCQVPVVATNVGSVRESVVHGETGFLVDVDDDQAMADFAVRLAFQSDEARRLGVRGRALVLHHGSLDAMVEGYTNLIEGVYDRRPFISCTAG